MNLILLSPADFSEDSSTVILRGRRLAHIRDVLRAVPGDQLSVGLLNGRIGSGVVISVGTDDVSFKLALDREPPPPLPVVLVMALPRPKVLNRVLQTAASMGVKRLLFINAWKVEKSFWKSPRISPINVEEQLLLGLEQAKDTVMPVVEWHRFFRRFAEEESEGLTQGRLALVADPSAAPACPRNASSPVTLVIGPEGGFLPEEVGLLEKHGYQSVSLGPRILRVEAAVPALLGRLF